MNHSLNYYFAVNAMKIAKERGVRVKDLPGQANHIYKRTSQGSGTTIDTVHQYAISLGMIDRYPHVDLNQEFIDKVRMSFADSGPLKKELPSYGRVFWERESGIFRSITLDTVDKYAIALKVAPIDLIPDVLRPFFES